MFDLEGLRSLHGSNWKCLSQGLCMPNINALLLKFQKWARLKFVWQTEGRMSLMSPASLKPVFRRMHCCQQKQSMTDWQTDGHTPDGYIMGLTVLNFILGYNLFISELYEVDLGQTDNGQSDSYVSPCFAIYVKSPSLGRETPSFWPHLPPRRGNLNLFGPHLLSIIFP